MLIRRFIDTHEHEGLQPGDKCGQQQHDSDDALIWRPDEELACDCVAEVPSRHGEMPLVTYASMWQSLDHFMALRMPILGNVTFLFYLIAIILFVQRRNQGMVWTHVEARSWRKTMSPSTM